MKKNYFKCLLMSLALSASLCGYAAGPVVTLGSAQAVAAAPAKAKAQGVVINGTGQSGTFTVNAANLTDKITLTASAGLEVYPETLPANATNVTVHVTLLSTMPVTEGCVYLRSGDFRGTVAVKGYGTPLEQKDLSANPVYKGADKSLAHGAAEGFTAGKDGYTVEFRVKTKQDASTFDAYAVTKDGAAFKAYIDADAIGLYNGESKVNIENSLNAGEGGKKSFYNTDGKYHTYRYAVTADRRVFVYRDGQLITILRTGDYGNQASWGVENGDIAENLLKNPGFEGEWNTRATDSLLNRVEGWIVDPIDRYNCNYDVINKEINNDLDHFNHVMKLQRYNWNDGWGAGTVSQIVDVAPNSTYSLSFLAQAGTEKKTGQIQGAVKIQEVQDSKLGTSVDITNEDAMKQYGMSYTTSAACRQIKVVLHNERFLNGGGWGSSPQPFMVDEMVLTGQSRVLDQKAGFSADGTDVEYFTYDCTGAYAPVTPVLAPAERAVSITGTGSSKTVKINIANLVSADKVSVSATAGFSVYPETLDASKDGEIAITLNSTLPETSGKVILRSGDTRAYINVTGYADDLERKDIKANPAFAGAGNSFAATAADGFTAGKDGYTVEFRVKTKQDASTFDAYAVTKDGAAFKTYVEADAIGLYNGESKVNIENPATSGDGGKKVFYNTDGKYHTYRYAVTTDGRVNVYRDGLFVANLRTADYGHQAEWAVENGDVVENLLKNPGFEGEWNKRASDNQVNRVEGWVVDPIDQYNCQYSVINKEIDNDLDYNNHVMKLQRYNWNDGWGAGTVSQIVDVAPNSTYSLSFLAQAGTEKKTGQIQGAVKIQEVQDSKLGTSVDITNEDAMKQYGMSYTTSAACRQIKVVLHNERFLNGGGWGSSPQPFMVDEMVLSGQSRVLDQKTGFNGDGTDVEYFAYDPTGAYAPLAPDFGDDVDGIDEVEVNAAYARTSAEGIALYNTADGTAVSVYDTLGMLVATEPDYVPGSVIALPARGMYVCVISTYGKTRNLKVIY